MSSVLAFDTATADTTVAVASGDEVEEAVVGPGEGRPRHAVALLPEVERLVAGAGGWPAIGRIVVGIGPGSFTGLRIGIATARALAQSTDTPLAGVCSLAALARGIAGDEERPRLALIDARRGEVFGALYDAAGEEVWPPFVASPEQLASRLSGLAAAPLSAGDGSLRFRDELEAAGVAVPADGDASHRLRARYLCELGARLEPVPIERVKPLYLRAPDAERWRDRARESR
jgi:tRNA threonylcarbamoyladenosine biosynthesis protein TsaB